MDKVIRVIQGTNGVLTCGKKYSQNLTLDQTFGRKKRKERKRERKRKLRERSSTFSLVFSGIRPVDFGRARRKVIPYAKSFK